jgi:hypothetical protein
MNPTDDLLAKFLGGGAKKRNGTSNASSTKSYATDRYQMKTSKLVDLQTFMEVSARAWRSCYL